MLRDFNTTSNNAELSVGSQHSVAVLLKFVDKAIVGFRSYYFSEPNVSGDENAITYHIANYFNAMLNEEEDGFIPYQFSFVKNPPQPESRKETDLGVVILNKSKPSFPIIEFEAKRLSESSNNSEYVYGTRGGIERFKRNQHGSHLHTCGMLGYIQKDVCAEWTTKINSWITDQANKDKNDLDWTHENEKLIHLKSFEKVDKWSSINLRTDQSNLHIYHYFIDLVV